MPTRAIKPKLCDPFKTCVRDETFSSTFTETIYGQAFIFSPLSYQCAAFGEQFQLYTNIEEHVGDVKLHNGVYPSFPHCEVPCYYSADTSKLSDMDFIIVDELQIGMADSWKLEFDTRGQSQCAAWVAARQNRDYCIKNTWGMELEERV